MEEKDQNKKSSMPEDWDKDAFPTSAKPVYRAAGLLVLLVAVLCAAVYYSSEHPEEEIRDEKRESIQDDLLADEQEVFE